MWYWFNITVNRAYLYAQKLCKLASVCLQLFSSIFETTILFAWMDGYSALLHNIAPGKYIVIKVEYGLQLHFKIFLNQSDRKISTTK